MSFLLYYESCYGPRIVLYYNVFLLLLILSSLYSSADSHHSLIRHDLATPLFLSDTSQDLNGMLLCFL